MEQNQAQNAGATTPKQPVTPSTTTPNLGDITSSKPNPLQNPAQQPVASKPQNIETEEPAVVTHELDVNPVMTIKAGKAIQQRVQIRCSVRRRPFTGGLPGSDPSDRQYKIGASLNALSKKCLKGVDGALEKVVMPRIIGIGANEPSFQREVDEYWNNIGVIIPSDEEAGKEEDKGKIINISFLVSGSLLKESIDMASNIEAKFNIISTGLIENTISIENEDMYFDFIFLGYCLKNKEVANDVDLMWYSPKIRYYILNKAITTAKKYNIIELKEKARPLFAELKNDDMKLNAMLMMFNLLPDAYVTTMDKVVALDEVYDKTAESLNAFISFAKDSDLDLKYLIKLAVKKNKITNHTGTEAYYYNQILLGKTLNDTVLFLKDLQPENQNIRKALEREVKE
jgi:hypothetical protein